MAGTYQALYRLWRPKNFSEMVGQEAVRRTLRNQVKNGRIAHAYLFCGSRGTGKTSAAKIMAKAVNCLNPHDGDPCCECENCRMIQQEQSLDVYEMDAASNSRVDEMREVLEKVEYPPQFGRYKVYIIDEVHMLSSAAFNALLKTLEEPPGYMVFILATTEPQKIPATILSRCQRFDFGRLTEAQIAGRLRQAVDRAGAEADDSALITIAEAAEGAMRDAFSLLDLCMGTGERITEDSVRRALGAADRETLKEMCLCIQRHDGAAAMRLADRVMREGWDVQVFLKDLGARLRKLAAALLCGPDTELLKTGDEGAKALYEEAGGFSVGRLLRLIDLMMKAEGDTRWAASPRSVLEVAVLSACETPAGTEAKALAERLGEMERTLNALKAGTIQLAPQTAAPALPQAETPPAKPVPKPSENDIWKKAKKFLQKNNANLYGLLETLSFAGFKNGTYCVTAPNNGTTYQLLNREDTLREVTKALKSAGEPDPKFAVLLENSAESREWADFTAGNIESLAETFGRERVIVTESSSMKS